MSGWAGRGCTICHVGGLLAEDLRPMADLAQSTWWRIARDLGIKGWRPTRTLWAGCWAYALGEHRRAVDLF